MRLLLLPQPCPRGTSKKNGKSCLPALKEEIEHILKLCTVEELRQIKTKNVNGCSVLLDKFEVKGEANVSKQKCCFKVSLSFTWEVIDTFGAHLGVTGSCKVLEFKHQDTAPEVKVRVSNEGRGVQAQAMIRWMKDVGAGKIGTCLNGPELSDAVLQEETASSDEDAAAEVKTSKKSEVLHPQFRDMTEWATTWLMHRLSALTVTLFGGLAIAKLSSPKVSGSASISSLEGQPRLSYQLQIECAWSVAASMAGAGAAEGSLIIADLRSDRDIASTEIIVEKLEGKKSSGQLVTAFRQQGVSAVRDLLGQFASELNAA